MGKGAATTTTLDPDIRPADGPHHRPHRVIIAVGPSEEPGHLVDHTARLIGGDAHFVLATVVDAERAPMAYAGGFEGPANTDRQEHDRYRESVVNAEGALAQAARAFGNVPVCRRVVERGNEPIGARLCALASEEDVDLVVVGSRGHGALVELVTGSVSSYVLHHSPCPVLLVPVRS